MTTEHSQSQNQAPETTLSTSDKRYQNSLANAVHDSQQAFGLEKYGITLDQVPDDKYNWQLMALEESVDMNQYLTREIRRLKEMYTKTHKYALAMEQALRDVLEENEKLQNHYDPRDPRGPIGPPGVEIVSVQKAKEMMKYGISD